ncbi:MAG: L-lysine 6-transaminase [Bacteroidetes bacterium]|nr:L-lysine 6-transaminase [Bacteroidota bacterium]
MSENKIEKPAAKKPAVITPSEVHSTLSRHMLADGFSIVVDFQKSHGSYVYDSKSNRELLDFFTFFASNAIGFNHPKITEPEFLKILTNASVNKPSNSDVYSVELAEFVETFSRIAQPSYLPYAFFIDGGALGVENALKTAFDWKIRKNLAKGYAREVGTQVIHFKNAFHGRTGYTMSLTNTDPVKIKYFPKFKWPRIDNPILTFPITDEVIERVKKEEATAIEQIKNAIHQNPDDIAALIIEPIQAEGGDNHFRKEFFTKLRTICDENDIMFIFDEVQVGVGITGKMWAHEYFVKPDMMSFGKKMHVCGFVAGKRVDEVMDNVFHVPSRLNSTFGGNLTDMVRAARILEIIEEENLVENARLVGDYLLKKLLEVEKEFRLLISNVRGLGLFCAMDLDTSQNRELLRAKTLEKGLILIGCSNRTIRFRPPLNLSKKEVDQGIDIIRNSLKEMKSA